MNQFSFDPTVFHNAMDGLADICAGFQLDLSCLVDGELDERAAGRALLHLETCSSCHEFFEDTRRFARMHRDIGDPERLMARLAALTGRNTATEAEAFDLVHRLASIFYQLGKAYTLAATDSELYLRSLVFEEAFPVDVTKNRGRGFVDGIMMAGRDSQGDSQGVAGRVDWQHARHMLNGRLEKIEDPLEKGRRLLEEAIQVDSSHEEAKLYLAKIYWQEQHPVKALEAFTEVFDTAVSLENRAHAASQIGRIYKTEGNYRKALRYWRWVAMTGLCDRDDRFWYVRFNIGVAHALNNRFDRALASFRLLLDRHPNRVQEFAGFIQNGSEVKQIIESQEGFAEAFMTSCPELFQFPGASSGNPENENPGLSNSGGK